MTGHPKGNSRKGEAEPATTPGTPALHPARRPQTNVELLNDLSARNYTTADLERVAGVYELARHIFAGRYCTSGKPFVCHLIGTAGALASVAAPIHVVVAGLLHSAYARGDFGSTAAGATPRKRREVRKVAGADAELLVFRFSCLPFGETRTTALLPRLPELDTVDRDTLLIFLCELLDHFVDGSVLYRVDVDRHRRFLREESSLVVELAARLGYAQLSEALRAAFALCAESEVPPALQSGPGDLLLAPRSFRRRWPALIGERLRRRRSF